MLEKLKNPDMKVGYIVRAKSHKKGRTKQRWNRWQ
jgi:hypothetical protein